MFCVGHDGSLCTQKQPRMMCKDSVFEKTHACNAPKPNPPVAFPPAHPPTPQERESESTSEEETLDALRVIAKLYGLGQHSNGSPMVPQPLLHLCQHPDRMNAWALGIIQRQCFVKGCFCLRYMPKLQYTNSSNDDNTESGDTVASSSQHGGYLQQQCLAAHNEAADRNKVQYCRLASWTRS